MLERSTYSWFYICGLLHVFFLFIGCRDRNDDKGGTADGCKMNSLGEFVVGFMGSQQIESDRGINMIYLPL